jgi:AcrR family transcriptional regulator
MDEIAIELGISKRTLYKVYVSKDELLQDVLSCECDEFKNYVAEANRESKGDGMYMLVKMMLYSKRLTENMSKRFFDELEKFHTDLFYEYWTKFKKENDEYMFHFMKIVQGKGYIRSEINIEAAYATMDAVIKNNRELSKSGKYTESDLKNSGIKPFVRGMFTSEGRSLLNKLSKELGL